MRFLVIRPGAIGDSLLTFPILHALRAQYHAPHITLVSHPAVLPLALAWGLVEEVEDYGEVKWSELFSTEGIHSSALKRQLAQLDLAVCWLRDPDGIVAHNMHEASVKRVIIAPGRPPASMRVHVVDYLAETVGLPHVGAQFIAPSSSPDLQWQNEHVGAQFIAPSSSPFVVSPHHMQARGRNSLRPYSQPIAIHPGSGGAQKCWPVASFAAVITWLWQQKHPVLLLVGPADHERITKLRKLLPQPPQNSMLHTLMDAPLIEVAAYLSQSWCYLGNDSGVTHLAAMLGIPTIALFGPSDPAVWHPIGSSVEVIYEPTLAELPVEAVIKCLQRRL